MLASLEGAPILKEVWGGHTSISISVSKRLAERCDGRREETTASSLVAAMGGTLKIKIINGGMVAGVRSIYLSRSHIWLQSVSMIALPERNDNKKRRRAANKTKLIYKLG